MKTELFQVCIWNKRSEPAVEIIENHDIEEVKTEDEENMTHLESEIRKRLNSLKPSVTRVKRSDGEIHQEVRDEDGNYAVTKLNSSFPGYVVDELPDLSISKILPWLYLGSQDVVFDYELLKLNNITHILSIGIPCPTYSDITNSYFEALDVEEFRIADLFLKCAEIIDRVLSDSGIIYVHCNAGVSRSPTIVAAYLVHNRKITGAEAIDLIKLVRPKVNPNPGFLDQLREYEKQVLLKQ